MDWTEEESDPANAAMQRAVQSRQQAPSYVVQQGLNYLKADGGHGLDPDTHMQMVQPLLEAKHFGYGGKPIGSPGSQGTIQDPSGQMNHGVLGFFGHVMGNLGLGGGGGSAGKLATLNGTTAAAGGEATAGEAAGTWAGADAGGSEALLALA